MTFGVSGKFVTACALGAAVLTGTVTSGQAAPVPVTGVATVAGQSATANVRYYGGGYRGGFGYRGGYGYGRRGFGAGPFVAGAALGVLGAAAFGGYGYGYGYGYPYYGGSYAYGYGYPVAYGYGYPYGYGGFYGRRYGYGGGFYGRGYGYGRGFGYGGRGFGGRYAGYHGGGFHHR